MLKTFPIEFVRQALEQTLLQEHIKNVHFFGGRNQINLSSFYQQLKNQDEVDRFVECYRDLVDQQNRTNLIGNGILMSPENPTITNLYSCLIVPMTWTCSLRCTLENRDQMLETINNIIYELKGAKCDIAQLNAINENGEKHVEPFLVGTIGHNDGAPKLKTGDYIGDLEDASDIYEKLSYLMNNDILDSVEDFDYLYCKNDSKLKVIKNTENYSEDIVDTIIDGTETISANYKTMTIQCMLNGYRTISEFNEIVGQITIHDTDSTQDITYDLDGGKVTNISYTQYQQTIVTVSFHSNVAINTLVNQYDDYEFNSVNIYSYIWAFVEDDGTYKNIIFPPEHDSFEKFKLSMSFDSLRCDTPTTLNAQEYCEISFGGSATLVNDGVRLGNDLVKFGILKYKINAQTPITFNNPLKYYLEPLEMPSGNNANTKINQLVSNSFLNNSHTDAIAITLQYTFVADLNIKLLEQWYDYGRFGTQNISASDRNTMTPNLIYKCNEYYSSWGNFEIKTFYAKIVESIDIENTEGDTMTIGVTMQVQGEND